RSRRTDVSLFGSSYVLMSQPYGFDTPQSPSIPEANAATEPPAGAPGKGEAPESAGKDALATKNATEKKEAEVQTQWIICGLITKSRFRQEATALSASVIAFGSGLFLLLL